MKHRSIPCLGAHMSVAGGLPRAVERAVLHSCDALQIFAKNANQWRGRLVPPDEIREFRSKLKASGLGPVVSHASYLINLATSDPALRRQSVDAMGDEMDRAEALGLLGVVLHPGSYTRGSESEGLTLIAEGLLAILRQRRRGKTMVLLEHTAGQGTALEATFEQLASIMAQMNDHPRVGVRHLLAGGVRGKLRAIRTPHRIRSAEGVPSQRLEETARQPGRSARTHRTGIPGSRAIPPPPQRSAIPRVADAARNAKDRRATADNDRGRSS